MAASFTGIKEINGFRRSNVNYVDNCERFRLVEHTFNRQYFPYYQCRLASMHEFVKSNAIKTWGNDISIFKLTELENVAEDQEVCVIGTLFKHMQLQPSILKEISEEHQLIPQPIRSRYIDESDSIMLQDERENVLLVDLDVASHVTGIVVAVKGTQEDNGNRFVVKDMCYSELPPQKIPIPLTTEDKYIVIISALGLSKSMPKRLYVALDSLVKFICGQDLTAEKKKISPSIVKVIIAGNCIGENARNQEEETNENGDVPSWKQKNKAVTIDVMQMVDKYLCKIGQSCPVDVLPGTLDSTSQLMPQQPYHPILLPEARRFESIKSVTNPYLATYDGILFMGSSGQTIDKIREYSELDDTTTIMEKTLIWRHLAPTAPDTLHCYPYADKDPFIITELPHVYFAGNQEKFETKFFEREGDVKCQMISVPKFEKTRTCVLVNLKNLDCQLLAFD